MRARRDPAAAMPDPASREYADAAVAGGWTAGRLQLPPPERQARTSLLAGLTFVYRRPMNEVDPGAAPVAVSGPSMENLRALCAATDAETRCAIALAGGTLVDMAADRGAVAKRGAAGDDCVVCLAAGRPDAAAWRDDPAWAPLRRCQPSELLGLIIDGDRAGVARLRDSPAAAGAYTRPLFS